MAHYAYLDENNFVVDVITGKEEGEDGVDWEVWYGNFRGLTCKRTSYNTYEGVHLKGGTPFRKNFAAIGDTYDETRDAFIPRKEYASWTLDESTCIWKAPVDYPTADGGVVLHVWDEDVYQADTSDPKTKGWVKYNVEGETP
jgi:hypothetical protein